MGSRVEAYITLTASLVLNTVSTRQLSGVITCGGALFPYFLAYYKMFDESFSYSAIYIVNPLTMCFQLIAMLAIVTSPYLFAVGYSLCVGFGSGLSTMNCIWASWAYFPERRGFATGVGIAGYALNTVIMNPALAFLVNPDDVAPNTNIDESPFPDSVASRVPWGCTLIGVVYAVVGILMVLLIRIKQSYEEKSNEVRWSRVVQCLWTKVFWIFYAAFFCAIFWWGLTSSLFKIYGIANGLGDHALSYTASIASLTGLLGRLGLPMLTDYYSVKRVLLCSLVFGIGLCILVIAAASSVIGYGLATTLSYMVGSGLYPLTSVATAEQFGPEMSQRLHPYMFSTVVLTCFARWGCLFAAEVVGLDLLWLSACGLMVLGVFLLCVSRLGRPDKELRDSLISKE